MAKPAKLPTQETINRLYVDLYNKIKAAKDDAQDKNRNLVVLLAENHSNFNSHFLVRMIALIGLRLGIKDMGEELDEDLIKVKSPITEELEQNLILRGQLFPTLLERVNSLYDNIPVPGHTDPDLHRQTNHDVTTDFLYALKFTRHPFDIKNSEIPEGIRTDEVESVRQRTTEAFETTMANKIKALADKVPCICSVGMVHMPPLLDSLSNTHSVLPINCGAGNSLERTAQAEKSTPNAGDLYEIYMSRHKRMKNIFAPAIGFDPQIPPGTGVRMMLEAQTRHQMTLGEITAAEGQTRLRQLAVNKKGAGKFT